MDETELDLHAKLSEAEVELQQAFDALKSFDLGLPQAGIRDIESMLAERDRLETEEKSAREQREKAWAKYVEYKRRQDRH